MKCLYDIENLENGEIVHRGLTAKEVNVAIGISRNYVYSYACKGLVYGEKYQIHNMGPVPNQNSQLADEWDRITGYLQRYPKTIRNIPIVQGDKD